MLFVIMMDGFLASATSSSGVIVQCTQKAESLESLQLMQQWPTAVSTTARVSTDQAIAIVKMVAMTASNGNNHKSSTVCTFDDIRKGVTLMVIGQNLDSGMALSTTMWKRNKMSNPHQQTKQLPTHPPWGMESSQFLTPWPPPLHQSNMESFCQILDKCLHPTPKLPRLQTHCCCRQDKQDKDTVFGAAIVALAMVCCWSHGIAFSDPAHIHNGQTCHT